VRQGKESNVEQQHVRPAEPEVLIDFLAGGAAVGYTSKSPLYAATRAGLSVEPVKVGRRSFMTSRERDALVVAHAAGLSPDEVRALVRRLHEARRARVSALAA
jgi:hypothetical protein